MMPGKKNSKGYAFVTFRTKDLALTAIQKLSNAALKVCFLLNLKVDHYVLMSILSLPSVALSFYPKIRNFLYG